MLVLCVLFMVLSFLCNGSELATSSIYENVSLPSNSWNVHMDDAGKDVLFNFAEYQRDRHVISHNIFL